MSGECGRIYPMENAKVLVIEDDEAVRRVIVLTLKSEGYSFVREAADGLTGLNLIRSEHPDLVLLDLMLPGLSGIELCRRVRADESLTTTPIIMLTARCDDFDIVAGLDAGANDYVTKPFSRDVLLARMRAALRNREQLQEKVIGFDGLQIFDSSHTVQLNGEALALTLTEYRILELLVRHHGRVFTREMILNHLSDGDKAVTDRTVDVQMVSLRKKLGAWAKHILTIRGIGYRVGE